MRKFLLAAATLAIAAAPAAAGAQRHRARATAHRQAPRAVDWRQHVERTPEGGYRMGNPNARVKLVEYGSITCPHCADFEAEAGPTLRDTYVRSGRVSYEYRPLILFPSDPGIYLLLGCQPVGKVFGTIQQLYATQDVWGAKVATQRDQLVAMGFPGFVAPAVETAGVAPTFRMAGLSQQRIATCLADQAALQRLQQANQAATDAGVQGTPTFAINGRIVDVESWAQLQELLNQS